MRYRRARRGGDRIWPELRYKQVHDGNFHLESHTNACNIYLGNTQSGAPRISSSPAYRGLKPMDHRSLILFASVIAFAVAGTSARAENGVTKDRIVFGQVAALEGPAQALGQGMRQGLLAAFAEVNR